MRNYVKGITFLPLAALLSACDNVSLITSLSSLGAPDDGSRGWFQRRAVSEQGGNIAENVSFTIRNFEFVEEVSDNTESLGLTVSGPTPLGIFSYYLSTDRTVDETDVLLAVGEADFTLPSYSRIVLRRHPGLESVLTFAVDPVTGDTLDAIDVEGIPAIADMIPDLIIPADVADGDYHVLLHIAPPAGVPGEFSSNSRELFPLWIGSGADIAHLVENTTALLVVNGLANDTIGAPGDTVTGLSLALEVFNRGTDDGFYSELSVGFQMCPITTAANCLPGSSFQTPIALTTGVLDEALSLPVGASETVSVSLDDFTLPADLNPGNYCFQAFIQVEEENGDSRRLNNLSNCNYITVGG